MIEILKYGKKTIGIKQSTKAVQEKSVKTAFIAKDADEEIVRDFIEMCKQSFIEIIYVDTMKSLGNACNIDVGASVACLLK